MSSVERWSKRACRNKHSRNVKSNNYHIEKMKNNKHITTYQFSPHLFWDVDQCKVDIHAKSQWIINRVLLYGHLSDWNLLLEIWTFSEIVETAKKMRDLDPLTLNFLSVLSNTPKESFRCYTLLQSSQSFWK